VKNELPFSKMPKTGYAKGAARLANKKLWVKGRPNEIGCWRDALVLKNDRPKKSENGN
jgi:hypothetical protein